LSDPPEARKMEFQFGKIGVIGDEAFGGIDPNDVRKSFINSRFPRAQV